MFYKSGEVPQVGDNVQHVDDIGKNEYSYDTVDSINKDGTLNINIGGMGIIPEIHPSKFILLENDWKSFWETMADSKENDILECEWKRTQRIVNNGDYAFMWEETWEPVKLNNEFIGAKWRKVKR